MGVDATATFFGPTGIIADTSSPIIYLPAGEYDVSGCPAHTRYMASSLKLQGAGLDKTVIKLLGPYCNDSLFSFAHSEGAGLHDLTIDVSGARANPKTNSQVIFLTASVGFSLDRVSIKGLKGDHWVALHSVGSTKGRVRQSAVVFDDCTNDFSAGVLLDNSYFGGLIRAGIKDYTMTVEATSGIGDPAGVSAGKRIVGHDSSNHVVRLDSRVVQQISGTKGGAGRYQLNEPSTISPGTTLYLVANDNWLVERSFFHNTILSFSSTNAQSRENEIDGWCSGGGIIVDGSSAGFKSDRDVIHAGSYVQDANRVFDAGLEDHADDTTITNPTIYDVGDVCIGINGLKTLVHGGSCSRFAQAARLDANAKITFDAIHLTVNDSNGAGSSVLEMRIFGSGSPGERYGIGDQAGVGASWAKNNTVAGVLGSPYHVVGGLIVVAPNAAMEVEQLSYVRPNKGTQIGILDAHSKIPGQLVRGGGRYAIEAIGTGTTFVVQ